MLFVYPRPTLSRLLKISSLSPLPSSASLFSAVPQILNTVIHDLRILVESEELWFVIVASALSVPDKEPTASKPGNMLV